MPPPVRVSPARPIPRSASHAYRRRPPQHYRRRPARAYPAANPPQYPAEALEWEDSPRRPPHHAPRNLEPAPGIPTKYQRFSESTDSA